jgi:hypothetical protein
MPRTSSVGACMRRGGARQEAVTWPPGGPASDARLGARWALARGRRGRPKARRPDAHCGRIVWRHRLRVRRADGAIVTLAVAAEAFEEDCQRASPSAHATHRRNAGPLSSTARSVCGSARERSFARQTAGTRWPPARRVLIGLGGGPFRRLAWRCRSIRDHSSSRRHIATPRPSRTISPSTTDVGLN